MNGDTNPYQPPSASLDEADIGESLYASRWARLGGALLDAGILAVVILPIFYLSGFYDGFPVQPSFGESIAAAIFSMFVWFAINARWLYTSGQSVGKRIVGIRIVDHESARTPSLTRLAATRYFLFQFLYIIPIAGDFIALADVVAIFGRNRRCLRDFAAKTRVVLT